MQFSTQEVNHAKKEVSRLKKLIIRFSGEEEAEADIKKLINRHIRFIEMAQQKIEDRKIVNLC